jgi:preprotein translocase subunit SecA
LIPAARHPARPAAADRVLAWIGFRLQQRFARTLRGGRRFAAEVAERAAQLAGADLPAQLPGLRYRLRRDGFRREHLRECHALLSAAASEVPAPAVLAAARRLAQGGIVELADEAQRQQALAFAAFAHALRGGAVHVLLASDVAAQFFAERLRGPFAALGLDVACVDAGMSRRERTAAYAAAATCAGLRTLAQDYLRDAIEAQDEPGAGRLMRRGLGCALVADADLAMLDDAGTPAVITADGDASGERLMYEQAIELARALAPGTDFVTEDGEIRLTPAAAALLERLVAPLGGAWAVRQHREQLIGLALEALHLFERDVDYRVADGRLAFTAQPEARGEPAASEPDEHIRRLVEVKEGCRLSARREVLARVPLPRFLQRYQHLAGVAADARGLEHELWALYGLHTARAGRRPARPVVRARVFVTADAKRAALAAHLHAAEGGGETLVVVRSENEALALQPAIGTAPAALMVFSPARGLPPRKSAQPAEVVVAELLEARRHLAWLCQAWRAERCILMLSLEEEAVAARIGPGLRALGRTFGGRGGELPAAVACWIVSQALRAAERAGRNARLETHAREQSLEDLLAFSGQKN